MALNGLFCADVPLRNYSLTHSFFPLRTATDQSVGPTDAANGSNEAF